MDAVATSIADAAKALGVGRTTLYRLIQEGRLDIVRLGRRTLVTVESIRRLVETSRRS